jgi:hypothetical protein
MDATAGATGELDLSAIAGPKREANMKKITFAAVALICTSALAQTQNFSPEDLARRTIERRAVEAAIWGMPIVAMDAVRQGFLRDMGAKYNDIVYYSKPADWKFQIRGLA